MLQAQEYLKKFDSDKVGITVLNLNDSSLTGELNLKGFANLERLSVENNELTSLDVRDCPKLKHLNIKGNPKLSCCYVYDLGRHLRNFSTSSLNSNNSNDSEREKEPEKTKPNNKNLAEIYFYPLVSQENELELKLTPTLPISSVGTKYLKTVAENNMLPRGSAFLTSSGELESRGIVNIIHAAPGSLSQKDEGKPNQKAVITATQNSIILAERNGIESLAIPFIGSNIFLSSIGGTKEQLAEIIMKSAINQRKQLKKIVFVPYAAGIEIKEGNITNFATHNCSVIVNAANMEGRFGAGLSGIIGQATGQSDQINQEAANYIKKFNKIVLEKKSDTKKLAEWLTESNISEEEYNILEPNLKEDEEYSLAELKELLLVEE
ncbi:10690_t:CDS:2 [Entrophospora sp. SA101]|nr:10690_t:CDS:2 [Entrophospora sp. SA101]